MSEKNPWLWYRLRRLEFQNGAKVWFDRARMLYNEQDHIIMVDQLNATVGQIGDVLDAIAEPDGTMPEFKTIFYDMVVTLDGREYVLPFSLRFYHPMRRGTGVRLVYDKGRRVIFFHQDEQYPMFSKEWTLRDVSDGEIDSDRAVWQFHGYKHER